MNEILIGCMFENNPTEYLFKCFDAVSVGDLAIVDTRYGFKIVTVTSINPDTDRVPFDELKEVVQVVDLTRFKERQEKAKKLKALKKKMDRKIKELQDVALYEMLAEKDPELKNLLSEFKALI